jgi:hypothetical protein
LDILDPNGELIQHRLYRDSCIQVDTEESRFYVKDLRILQNRNLEDLVIVDNAVISFAYQMDNGIPILPFREDKEDIEFLHLMNIMKEISMEHDCRSFVRKSFKLGEIMKTDMESYVHYYEMSDDDLELDDDSYLDMLASAQRTFNASLQKNKSAPSKLKKRKKKLSLKKCKKFKSQYVSAPSALVSEQIESRNVSQKCIPSEFAFVQNPAFSSSQHIPNFQNIEKGDIYYSSESINFEQNFIQIEE